MLAPAIGVERAEARQIILVRPILETSSAVAIGGARGRVDERHAYLRAPFPQGLRQSEITARDQVRIAFGGIRHGTHVDDRGYPPLAAAEQIE
jgi:hypothetical protein